eukprot:TRINITY_DN36154_c0_g1_i1.p1 TRINITY_DN36154_c0_g1~~TRINITY_DN36154_c0_g1_i1.p1  ORF type:complete len:536 (+),score=132.44 TRINITY_DN36154_c0_g1_i1:195-1802(+)
MPQSMALRLLVLLLGACSAAAAGSKFGPGDPVEVVVMDAQNRPTKQWVKAIVLGLREDGGYDLVLRGGEAVTPALETGIRDEHLRSRRPCALDALSEPELLLAEVKLQQRKGEKDPDNKKRVGQAVAQLLRDAEDGGADAALKQVLNALSEAMPELGIPGVDGQPGPQTALTSTETGASLENLENLTKKLDKEISQQQKVLRRKEKKFDRLRGEDPAAKEELMSLRDQISKLHQGMARLIRDRDARTGIDPELVRLKIGEKVFAEWNSRGAWYPGKVQAVAEGKAVYHVVYDDGDQELSVPVRRIRAAQLQQHVATAALSESNPKEEVDFKPGDSVLLNLQGKGRFVPGKITSVGPGKTYAVEHGGTVVEGVQGSDLKQVGRRGPGFKVGDRVMGAYLGPRGGHGLWYPGTITKVGSAGEHSIAYDDGDLEDDVSEARIRQMEGPGAQQAAPNPNMEVTTVLMAPGPDGKMEIKTVKANLGSILGADSGEVLRRLEAVLRGEEVDRTEADVKEELPGQLAEDPKRSTIVRLAATY